MKRLLSLSKLKKGEWLTTLAPWLSIIHYATILWFCPPSELYYVRSTVLKAIQETPCSYGLQWKFIIVLKHFLSEIEHTVLTFMFDYCLKKLYWYKANYTTDITLHGVKLFFFFIKYSPYWKMFETHVADINKIYILYVFHVPNVFCRRSHFERNINLNFTLM